MIEADSASVTPRLIQLASRRSGAALEHIGRNTPLQELGIDSLGMAELIFDIDDTFHIEITDAHIAELRTVGDLIDCVERQVAQRAGS
jgi:acyl carrier protein